MKHAELIARLEAAEVGGNALSIDVLEAITGGDWRPGDGTHRFINNGDGTIGIEVTPVTTSLDAALALAERVGLDPLAVLEAVVKMRHPLVEQLPRSCCIAILKALEAKQCD